MCDNKTILNKESWKFVKNKQSKYEVNEKVYLKATKEIVTISNTSYVANMKRYSYTLKEYPNTFYFEEELNSI